MMLSLVPALAHVFEPWKSLYSNSKTVATIVTSLHLVALFVGGGLALGADRATLRAGGDPEARARVLGELHGIHRPVLIALTVVFVSGIALAAADIETFVASPAFWVKLLLVALLVVNGAVLTRTERALRAAPGAASAPSRWRRLRATAWLSLTLWVATVVAGTVLVNAA
jgi:uncharacterized membrane protein SirB2